MTPGCTDICSANNKRQSFPLHYEFGNVLRILMKRPKCDVAQFTARPRAATCPRAACPRRRTLRARRRSPLMQQRPWGMRHDVRVRDWRRGGSTFRPHTPARYDSDRCWVVSPSARSCCDLRLILPPRALGLGGQRTFLRPARRAPR